MDTGFVYIARLIDYSGNFLGSFHKIGKTKQYKIRETQLNSTHLPVDILFVRVFETDNQSSLEQILHICFEDYRIKKKYDDRKNITTEWFDVDDVDILNSRIDKLIKNMPNVNEINVINHIVSDSNSTIEEKEEYVSPLKRTKTKLTLKVLGEDLTQDIAADTFTLGLCKIADKIGWDKLDYDEDLISKDLNELSEKWVISNTGIREINEYKIWTGINNSYKSKILNKHIMRNNISDIEVNLQTVL